LTSHVTLSYPVVPTSLVIFMTRVADCPGPTVCAGAGVGVVGVADPVTGTVVCALVAGTGVVLVVVVVPQAPTMPARMAPAAVTVNPGLIMISLVFLFLSWISARRQVR
jgi:hypothetical protein